MSLIDSGRRAIITVRVKLPADLPEAQAPHWLATQLSFTAALMGQIEATHIEMQTIQPTGLTL